MKTIKTKYVFIEMINRIAKKRKSQLILLIALAICNVNTLSAQNLNAERFRLGIGTEAYFTGSSHGMFYSAYLNVSKGKGALNIGPVMQQRSLELKGAKCRFTYKLARRDNEEDLMPELNASYSGNMELNFFTYVQYVNKASLSYAAARVEGLTNPEVQKDWNALMLSTAEAGFGVEIDIHISKRIVWKNFIGASAFYHIDYEKRMYHERIAPTMTFGTGINIPEF